LSERPIGARIASGDDDDLALRARIGMPRLLIVDDHPLYRHGFVAALRARMPGASIHAVADASAAITDLDENPETDLVVIDFRLPGMDGIEALSEVGRRHPQIPRILMSGEDDPSLVRRAVAAGASGFVPKSLPVDELEQAISRVLAGDVYVPPAVSAASATQASLTLRQIEVLAHLAAGRTNREIAEALRITERTAKAHVAAIFAAFGVDNRTQAVVAGQQAGYVATTRSAG
jgi:DNA-binding NarL/FixJ family response regulator